MIFPLFSYETISPLINLLLALFIGIGFGFILEKSGLGNAKKLIGQFLLKDLSVLKVMFSAIVTAMLGAFLFSKFGWLNLELITFSDSYFWAQAIAGLMLGIGFVVAGYCPGTTIVAIASGRIDAMYSLLGLFVGALIFTILYQWLKPLYFAAHLTDDKLPQIFGLPYSHIVALVIVVAIMIFYLSEKIEARMGEKKT